MGTGEIILGVNPAKRKFRELKTANEEKALLEKAVPKSKRYVTKVVF